MKMDLYISPLSCTCWLLHKFSRDARRGEVYISQLFINIKNIFFANEVWRDVSPPLVALVKASMAWKKSIWIYDDVCMYIFSSFPLLSLQHLRCASLLPFNLRTFTWSEKQKNKNLMIFCRKFVRLRDLRSPTEWV